MKKLLAIILALTMVFCLAACGEKSESGDATKVDPIHLMLGHTNNTEHHYQVLAERFKELVEAGTNGEIIIDIYPAEQLGSGTEMLEAVKSGTQDIVLDPDAYLANYDPMFNIMQMPFTFENWDQVKAFIGSDVCVKLEGYSEAQNMTILGWTANGFRYFTTKKPVNSPADLKGLKIRIGSSAVMADIMVALGVNPTTLSMSDTYSGIQTGIVDGQENPTANIMGSKFYEVAPYLAVTGHMYSYEPLIMNTAKLNSLTADQQKVIREAAKTACDEDIEYCIEYDEDAFSKIEAVGGTVTFPDLAPFKEAVKPVVDVWCEKLGPEFTNLYNDLVKTLQ